ncbi:MAG: YggS family pyridoxal phosphate-dependent enzyme [Acidimicrobiales bacterium]|nr:YggS family pyridoxal phosphate-dependent enzyme [Acidimicrobiales bacterium]
MTANPETVSPDAVAERLDEVRRRVERSGADPGRIRIVAVTKGFGADAVEAARAAGLDDVGENYAQELLDKAGQVGLGARWHFLGPVQRNKVRRLAPVTTAWHGVDRLAAAEAVSAAAPGVEVFVEVNVARRQGRPGCPPDSVDELVNELRDLPLDVSGLMAVAPADDPEGSRACFRWLAGKARQLGLRELSMGMSDDFEAAVAEGATTLRLGRVLFGPRPERPRLQR